MNENVLFIHRSFKYERIRINKKIVFYFRLVKHCLAKSREDNENEKKKK